ncbi:Aste57867_21640 [Aphanomyces stellatus]|uniref:Aste57867_21640 protein n=1 Tax=Aphanomyces stellatus TaxID=120398 RepID=A0A485LJA6_9STRA|nr:hypothetical protein As57867_021571 [Aphanomyces stellatus]VFT98309.1 Aste57867_21640 [Aphanomyces stellatus]
MISYISSRGRSHTLLSQLASPMTSTPFTPSAQQHLTPMAEGTATLASESGAIQPLVVTEHATGLSSAGEDIVATITQEHGLGDAIALNTSTFLARVEQYAETGKVDVDGLSSSEVAALQHVLRRLHASFVKQIDCDEIKCDAGRKCPKCGAARTKPEKLPKSPTAATALANGTFSSASSPKASSGAATTSSPRDVDMS